MLYNKITGKRNKGGAKIIGIKRRKYSKEQKEEIVQRALSGERIPYFIEDVYNNKRLHLSLGYRPPEEYKRLLVKNSFRECMVC